MIILKQVVLTMVMVIGFCTSKAQIYNSDTLSVEIRGKDDFLVNDYKDLNIDVAYTTKSNKRISVYEKWLLGYKSTYGNCYFELYKFDTSLQSSKNITLDVMGTMHGPKDFDNPEEIMRYDPKKIFLKKGDTKILTFNLLDFVYVLPKGSYYMIFYTRAANNLGYDKKGKLIANSLCFLESTVMSFKLDKDVYRPGIPHL